MIPVIPFAYNLEVDELMVEDFVCLLVLSALFC
jgi:hypothetical protein